MKFHISPEFPELAHFTIKERQWLSTTFRPGELLNEAKSRLGIYLDNETTIQVPIYSQYSETTIKRESRQDLIIVLQLKLLCKSFTSLMTKLMMTILMLQLSVFAENRDKP